MQRAIGLMSGTSLDGIDAAYVETDGEGRVVTGPSITIPYDANLRAKLRGILGGLGPVAEVEYALTEAHAEAVSLLRQKHGLRQVDLIGFHGHTILHRPEERRTWQIGDGALLARLTGIDVVCDFRSNDVRKGGQGAPLVPVYHRALAQDLGRPIAVLNIGGVANVTWIGAGEGDLLAFDTGPGNALIDDWMLRHIGEPIDEDGKTAASGRSHKDFIEDFLRHPFFAERPPKSIDRDDFARFVPEPLSLNDGAATLAAMTAAAVAAGTRFFPTPAARWIVTGGGRRNPVIMAELARRLGVPVGPVEEVGWDGDALEAQAFGYLAVRSVLGLPLSFPGTTACPAPLTGGIFFPAGN